MMKAKLYRQSKSAMQSGLGNTHDQMTLSYQSFDRRVYAQGALTACAWLYPQPPGFYTMTHVVGALG